MKTTATKDALRREIAEWRGLSVGFVPTMGYLHEGHMALFRRARAENDRVVASIFVNPTQFGPTEDLDRYPRDPDGDSAKCRACGVDLLWMPPASSVYERDHCTTVAVAGLTETLCGPRRPGHFDGVATVVAKLLLLVAPSRAYFGEKDYQQLAVIRRMVRDLDIPVDVIGCPTVREPDGLAMSSRNVYLSADNRRAGRALSRALGAAQRAWHAGERTGEALSAVLRARLAEEPGLVVEYADVVDPDSLALLDRASADESRGAVAAVAARAGVTRLIDNARLDRHDLDALE